MALANNNYSRPPRRGASELEEGPQIRSPAAAEPRTPTSGPVRLKECAIRRAARPTSARNHRGKWSSALPSGSRAKEIKSTHFRARQKRGRSLAVARRASREGRPDRSALASILSASSFTNHMQQCGGNHEEEGCRHSRAGCEARARDASFHPSSKPQRIHF